MKRIITIHRRPFESLRRRPFAEPGRDRRKAMRSGFDHPLTSPVDVEAVLELLANIDRG